MQANRADLSLCFFAPTLVALPAYIPILAGLAIEALGLMFSKVAGLSEHLSVAFGALPKILEKVFS